MRKSLLILVLTINIILHAASAVTLKVSPRFQFEPGYVLATIVIEPDADNRSYCFVYDGTFSGSHCEDLEGARASRTRWFPLKDLPAGEYAGQVKVRRNDGSVIGSAVVEWSVLDRTAFAADSAGED